MRARQQSPTMAARGGAARSKRPGVNAALIALFVLLASGFYHLPRLGLSGPRKASANEPIAVDARVFTYSAASTASPLFTFEGTNTTFIVRQTRPVPDPGDPQRYTLLAHLVGPLDLFFSCWMVQGRNGSYTCPEIERLDIGHYYIQVMLFRAPAASPPPTCAAAARALLKGRRGRGPLFSVLEFIKAGEFKSFKEYERCFQYPAGIVVDTSWVKLIRRIDAPSNWKMRAIYEAPPCEGAGGRGRWIPGGGLCPGSGSCAGVPFEPVELQPLNLVVIDMQHVFLPFACVPRFISTVKEGARCVADSKLYFAGDIRLQELAASAEPWLRPNGPVPFLTDFGKEGQGLAAAMAGSCGAVLRQALRSGHTVVINTLLDDLKEDTIDALEGFYSGIAALRKELEAAAAEAQREGRPPPRLFWVSLTRRAPQLGDLQPGDWQTPDILWELEDYAAAELEAAGGRRIDLRWMMSSAPARWWTPDGARWASPDLIVSFYAHVTVQTILIEVCPQKGEPEAAPSFLNNPQA